MKKILFILMAFFGLFSSQAQQAKSIHSFKVKALDGKTIDFSKFKGKKILIVNTASECGFTSQYEGLQKLYETYKDQLVIVGFPANNFGGQEPGSNEEIGAFCKKNYLKYFVIDSEVGFVVLTKVSINSPFSLSKNFSKFQRMVVLFTPFSFLSVKNLKMGAISFPFTETLAAIGKVTP